MANSDPCHLEEDAVAGSAADLARLITEIQAAMELSADRMDLLYQCRLDHPGSGSDGGGDGGGPVDPP
jgi:hypothetical protein